MSKQEAPSRNPSAGTASNPAVWPATITSAALVAQLIAGKAARDALFLTHFELTLLPAAMIGAALLSALAVLAVSRALSTAGPARVLPITFAASALLFALSWALSLRSERATALAVYAHTAIINLAIGSAFWSLVNERFDPHTAKRLVGRIASGGTAGGVIGGLLVWGAAERRSVPAMLALLAAMSLIGLWSSIRFARRAPKLPRAAEPSAASGFKVFRETPYLRDVALLVTAAAATQALLDWLFNAHASHRYRGEELLSFLAVFNMTVSVLSFLAQLLLTRTILEKQGLSGAIKLQSASVGAMVLLALLAPVFVPVLIARAVEHVTRSSLYRSAYELLYTPLPSAKKRPTKMLIDVGVDRLGTALASAGLFAVAHVGASLGVQEQLELQTRLALLAVLALSAAALYIAVRLHRGYVAALADSLKSGAIALGDDDVEDLTTRRTLAETSALLDRKQLLVRIEEFQARKSERSRLDPPPAGVPVDGPADDLADRLAALRSNDPAAIERALAGTLPAQLVPFAIPLLGHDAFARDVVRCLREIAPKTTGLLLDHLLDAGVDPRVRRRLPKILQACHTQRAASGLLLALEDPEPEVRTEVALALAQLMSDAVAVTPRIELDHARVLHVVRDELTAGRSAWSDGEPRRRGLGHVFVLLGLVLEREPLAIAYRALRAEDPALRGTALEYLEVVLPPDVRALLMPQLGDVHAPPRQRQRGTKELADALLRSRA